MKKILLFVSSLMLSSLCFANGSYTPGTVSVYNNNNAMYGAYNVRFNPAVSTGRVFVGLNPGSSLTISATSSSTGAGFFCALNSTNSPDLFSKAEKAVLSLGNGSMLIASRLSASNTTCTTVQIQTGSDMLH